MSERHQEMLFVNGNVLRLEDQTVIKITRQDHIDYITIKHGPYYCCVKMRYWYYSNFDGRKSYSSVNEFISNSTVGSGWDRRNQLLAE